MIQFLSIGKTILGFSGKHWKMILSAFIVGIIVFTIYSQKLEISELASDLVMTQAQLEDVKDKYATQTELNKVRNEIATANLEVMNRVNQQNRRVSTSLSEIESQVVRNGSEVDKIKMELHPSVVELLDKEIESRGYNNGK